MSSRGSTRGGRGARSGRGGRGASATAAVPSTRPSIEQSAADGEAPAANAPATAADRTITIESSLSATNSPAATPAPPARGGRFKPKAVRRDAAERQHLEDQRNRDLAAKIKVEEREQRDADRRARRGGRGRGRGDAGFIRRTVTSGGVLSGIGQGMASRSAASMYPIDKTANCSADMLKRGGWGKHGDSGFKAEGQYSNRYHDRRVNDVRVNVDTLRDSATPEVGLSNGTKSSGVLPVGIIRVEHKQEEAKVATSAELEAEEQEDDDEELFVSTQAKVLQREMHMADDDEIWNEGPKKPVSDGVMVKPEPGTEADVMDIDDIPARPKAPDSPELQKKPLAHDLESNAKAKAKERKREKVLQDPELQAAAIDTATLLDALSLKDGEAQDKDNQLFLFQFPPILPPLIHLNEDGNEVVDVTDGADGIRTKPEHGKAGLVATNSALPPQGGYIGRLNVRKSGKIELDWGGRILDLGIATDTDYLTTAVIVDEEQNEGAGKATGMGLVYGKFVATPVFQEEDDWNPDLDDLGLSV